MKPVESAIAVVEGEDVLKATDSGPCRSATRRGRAPVSPLPDQSEISPSPGISLTQQQKEQLLVDAAFQFGKAYLRCRGEEHKAVASPQYGLLVWFRMQRW
jgi:hypothetical protein